MSSETGKQRPVTSPCVKTCQIDGASGLCMGCGRTLNEIAGWGGLSEAERLAIMETLPARLASERES